MPHSKQEFDKVPLMHTMDFPASRNPLFRWPSLVAAALSLSIGWGIRGNFGHEFGAMMPGMLCAVAVCLFSGRGDWRERVPFFAVFGALGWGFGGSIAYMPTMSYTQSGHLATQLYGWITVFIVGFLWTSMGAAGTAYAGVETRERLTAVFRPLCWVLAAWTIEYFLADYIMNWLVQGADNSDLRHRNPLYWLDSEWMEANWALLGLCLFELWDRRLKDLHWAAVYGAVGAAAGWLAQWILGAAGWLAPALAFLVRVQGDPRAINPATGQPFGNASFLTNWPQLFFNLGGHLGWILGLSLGLAVFFWRYGRWRSGSSLLLHITVGSYLVFLAGPVLLSCVCGGLGGFRMMPPRGDSWANIVGAFAGMLVYMYRNGLAPVGQTSIIAGMLGGLGFVLAQFAKILLYIPGNPQFNADPAWLARWAHWHSANWHNLVVEQGVGLLYGLAIVVSMGLLAGRLAIAKAEPRVRKWTESFSVFFILSILLYVNLVKNIEDWTRPHNGHTALPALMKAPLIPQIELTALGWFNVTFLLMGVCLAAILWAHQRRPLDIVPRSWTGKGQLFYLVFLWAILLGNWEKALPAFTEQRLDTEWVMIVNGLLATFLILVYVRDGERAPEFGTQSLAPLARRTAAFGLAALLVCMLAFTSAHRWIYDGRWDGYGGLNLRFGDQAEWRIHPTLRDKSHP
jgi:hypothetical protein